MLQCPGSKVLLPTTEHVVIIERFTYGQHDSLISSFITLRVKATKTRPASGLAVLVCTC